MTLEPELPFKINTGGALRFGSPRSHATHSLADLYDRHGQIVYRFALKLLTNPHEAEELTQDVFLTFWQKGEYDPNRGSAKQLLMTLTYSRGIDRLRRRGIHARALQRLDEWEQSVAQGDALEVVMGEERKGAVRKAMDNLTFFQRQCLQLYYFQGLTQVEIAQTLDIPLGTVKSRCRDALINLKKLLHDL